MTDLLKLNVSLTKHGAHKLAILLGKYDKDTVLENLWGSEVGVNVDEAQAKKNLSVDRRGVIPGVWEKARKLGQDAVDALVLIAIISSHHKLISALKLGSIGDNFEGEITRGKQLDAKAFTNFSNIFQELGYCTSHSQQSFTYSFKKLFSIEKLNNLAVELLQLKLKTANWDGVGTVENELIRIEFNKVFSISEQNFKKWLDGDTKVDVLEDIDFFTKGDDESPIKGFIFQAGHKEKKIGIVKFEKSKEEIE
jgi:hypothetical protein